MRTKTGPNGSADRHVKEIKRNTRRQFSAEAKIRIVLDGLRGESSSSIFAQCDAICEMADAGGSVRHGIVMLE